MNPLLHWLNAPEWTQLVAALLHSLWQGALLAILLAVLLRRLIQPRLRYYASLGTLGILVLASIITWAVLTAPKTNAPVAPAPLAIETPVVPAFAPAFNLDSPDKIVAIGTPISPAPPTVPWTAWLALVWMLGALAMLFRAGIRVAGAEKLRRSCQPLTDETMTLLVVEACRAINLARKIRVAVTDQLTSPAVVGILVPTLILPLSLFTTLTPEQIRFILLHELAHIRRGDYLANLFQLLAEALLFFNPAVWWLSHHIRREREACCDALAIELSGAPADYAKTLVRVAENTLPTAPTTALAFGEDGREPSSLADRVQRLLVPGYRPALRLTWQAMLMSLFVGGTLLFLSAVGTRNTVGAILATEKTLASSIGNNNGGQLSDPPAIQFKILAGNLQTNGTTLVITNSARIKFDEQVEETEVAADVITIENGFLTAQGNVRIIKANITNTGQDWSINLQSRRIIPLILDKQPADSGSPDHQGSTVPTSGDIVDPRQKNQANALAESTFNQLIESIEERDGMHISNSVPLNISTGRVARITTSLIEHNLAATDNLPSHPANSESMPPHPIEISGGGSLSVDQNSRTISITNGGRIKFSGQEVTADHIQIDQATGDVVARGNARFIHTSGTYSGSELRFNLTSNLVSRTDDKLLNAKQTTQATRFPTSIEFVGHDLATAATFVPKEIIGASENTNSVFPLPVFRVRQFTTSNNWGDVQTNLLGGIKDKVPFLGDIPWLAEYFTSRSSQSTKQDLGPVITTNHNQSFGFDDWTMRGGSLERQDPTTRQWFWYRTGAGQISTQAVSQLSQRTFDVDPVKLYEAVRKAAADPASVNRTNFASAFRNYFSQTGLDFDPSTGRSFYLSDTRGQMWVRATATELDVIEKLLEPMRGGRTAGTSHLPR
jgi:beta-lactamase regulating signal transducer with metallopeptidase domain